MMVVKDNNAAWAEAWLDTPLEGLALKKRGAAVTSGGLDDFGILVDPPIVKRDLGSPGELAKLIDALPSTATVKVRGHGWDYSERFIWTGTPAEFNSTWIID